MMHVFVNLAAEISQFPKTDKYVRKKRDKMEKIASWMFPLFSSSEFSLEPYNRGSQGSLLDVRCDVTRTKKTKEKEEKY